MADRRFCQISFFITAHGLGHAARAAAVAEALQAIIPDLCIGVFTPAPLWFFENSLTGPFVYHHIETDVGLVQDGPLRIDLAQTIRRLNHFYPRPPEAIAALADMLKKLGTQLVVADISPVGIQAARQARLPSVLIENFTWDWIYESYKDAGGDWLRQQEYLKNLYRQVDCHIQTEPVCAPKPVHFTAGPTSRKTRRQPDEIRRRLGLTPEQPVVLVTMGGIPFPLQSFEDMQQRQDIHFIVPGREATIPKGGERRGNVTLLPFNADYAHQDLVNACRVVVGKVGYSSVAEIYHSGAVYGYILRSDFRESVPLGNFIRKTIPGFEIAETDFHSGQWLTRIDELLALTRNEPDAINGADAIAGFLADEFGLRNQTGQEKRNGSPAV